MEFKSGNFFFYNKFLWKDHRGDREEKMENAKARKEVIVKLFIVE